MRRAPVPPVVFALVATLLLGPTAATSPEEGRGTPPPRSETAPGDQDYAPHAIGWNGLAYLSRTADEAHVGLHVRDAVDWRGVDRDDVLCLLFPLDPPREADVQAFLEDGGHVVVADDFGGGAPLLAAFGLRRVAAPVGFGRTYGGHPAFPLFPLSDPAAHFLFFHTDRIVANHPTALVVEDTGRCAPIVSWPGSDAPALVAECVVGRGRLLAVADASLFINGMLRGVHGDKQFVANVLRYFCGPTDCEVDLVLPRASWSGRYRAGPPPVTDVDSFFLASVTTLDHLIAEANEALRELPLAPWLGFAMCLLVLPFLGRHLVGRRRRPFPGFRATLLPALSEAEVRARTLAGRHRSDFSEPLALLRRRLEDETARNPAGERRRELDAVLERVRQHPTAPRVVGRRLRTVSAAEFLALYRRAKQILEDAPRSGEGPLATLPGSPREPFVEPDDGLPRETGADVPPPMEIP